MLPSLRRLSLHGPSCGRCRPQAAVGVVGPGYDANNSKACSEADLNQAVPGTPAGDRGGPSSDTMREDPASPDNKRQRTDDVYSEWVPNEMDSTSYTITKLGDTKHDKFKTYDEDFIEVEVACSLFSRLSTAVSTYCNDRGEPNNWQFDNPEKHQYLMSAKPRMDQPWLTARLNHETHTWEVIDHEGRHRSAWVCNHMNYKNLTVLIGLYWNADNDDSISGAKVMDIFTGGGARAQLVRNPRKEGVEFKLTDVTRPSEESW